MKIRKSLLLVTGTTVALLISFYGCKKKSEPVKTISATSTSMDGSGEIYLVDTVTSTIEWVGSSPGNYQHTGTIRLSKGQLTANQKQLTSGQFTIDINSIANLDQTGKDKSNLESHLKNQDFFEVEKYPFGSFEITNIIIDSTGQRIVGNLTLKKITNSIEIPAMVRIDDKFIVAETSSFMIDRTKWGIVYNSGIIGTIKDDLINDEISLKLKIVAAK